MSTKTWLDRGWENPCPFGLKFSNDVVDLISLSGAKGKHLFACYKALAYVEHVLRSYLHGEMVDEAQPAHGMFEEHIKTLLECLTAFVMKNVFCFESLVDWQRDGIIGIFHWRENKKKVAVFLCELSSFSSTHLLQLLQRLRFE